MIDSLIKSPHLRVSRGDRKLNIAAVRTRHIRYRHRHFYLPPDPDATMVAAVLRLAVGQEHNFHTELTIRQHRDTTAVRLHAYVSGDVRLPTTERIAAALGRFQYVVLPDILVRCERALLHTLHPSLEDWQIVNESLQHPTILASRLLRPNRSVYDLANCLGTELAVYRIAIGDYEYRPDAA